MNKSFTAFKREDWQHKRLVKKCKSTNKKSGGIYRCAPLVTAPYICVLSFVHFLYAALCFLSASDIPPLEEQTCSSYSTKEVELCSSLSLTEQSNPKQPNNGYKKRRPTYRYLWDHLQNPLLNLPSPLSPFSSFCGPARTDRGCDVVTFFWQSRNILHKTLLASKWSKRYPPLRLRETDLCEDAYRLQYLSPSCDGMTVHANNSKGSLTVVKFLWWIDTVGRKPFISFKTFTNGNVPCWWKHC